MTSGVNGVELHLVESNKTNGVKNGNVQQNGEGRRLLGNSTLEEETSPSLCCRQKIFTMKRLKRHLPFLVWLPKYSLADLKGDIVAGSTVALTVIPQGLALAQLANLPPQYGLYTAFMGCFAYAIFGSCKDLTIGPTAIMSLMTAEYVVKGGVTYSVLITFLAGCIQFAMGLLNLGFLITFISAPVISGFTSAAAITIAVTQLSGIFGLKSKSHDFIGTVGEFFDEIKTPKVWDLTMGLISVVFLLVMKFTRNLKFSETSSLNLKVRKCIETVWWTLTTARNALVVVACGGIAALLLLYNINVLTLTKEVEPGLPSFKIPAFTYSYYDNSTNATVYENFLDIAKELGSGILIIPLLSILEAIAIAKAFAKGKKLDATQEMIALGLCNVAGSFVSAYPATGSFSRTAINYSSGVRTPLGGIFTGSLVLLALGVMSPYFRYIPKASLSALIFVAVLNMVHYKDVIVIWRTNKWDLLPYTATFLFSFILGLEYGIAIGVSISLLILLYQEARPKIIIEERKTQLGVNYLYVKPDRTVFFPSTEYLASKINKAVPDCPDTDDEIKYTVVFDGSFITGADYTMAMGVKNMINNLKNENISILFINLKTTILGILKGAAPCELNSVTSIEVAEDRIQGILTGNSSETVNGKEPVKSSDQSIPVSSNSIQNNHPS